MQWQSEKVTLCYLLWWISVGCGDLALKQVHDPSLSPGHMKPFGSAGPFFNVPIIQGFPSPWEFLDNYVVPSIPVVIRGASKSSPAFTKWTDDFFIKHPDALESIFAEVKKKEIRNYGGKHMSFRKFVKMYKKKDFYMVNPVPNFLRPDILIPPPLRCKPALDNLDASVMWFSSGGTRSVLHNDDVDNINCLYRGNKTLTFISPFETDQEWDDKVLDYPSGSYSGVDVDAVDFAKYPQLANVRYGVVHMEAGDCLFIPYKWYHQVNSFGSNLAVNLWFHHRPQQLFKLSAKACGNFSADLYLNQVTPGTTDLYGKSQTGPDFDESNVAKPTLDEDNTDVGEEEENDPSLVGLVSESLETKGSIDVEELKSILKMMTSATYQSWSEKCEEIVWKIFKSFDVNGDSVVNKTEYDAVVKDEKKLDDLTTSVNTLFENLLAAQFYAQRDKEWKMIKDLVRNGDIDFNRAREIYGERFVEGIKPHLSVKEEL